MTPFKSEVFKELEAVLAKAGSEQIARLLSDIATGQYRETAETRAGLNDNRTNVIDMCRAHNACTTPRAKRDTRRMRYSS